MLAGIRASRNNRYRLPSSCSRTSGFEIEVEPSRLVCLTVAGAAQMRTMTFCFPFNYSV